MNRTKQAGRPGTMGLFTALMRNINSRALNREMIGYAIDECEVTVERDRVLSYARATGDTNPEYAKERAIVPPFFLSGLVHDQLIRVLTHRDLGLNLLKMVHGEQEVAWHVPVRIGDRVRGRVFVKDIHDTPAGEMMTVSAQGFIGDALAVEALMGFLVRGGGTRPVREKRAAGTRPARGESFRAEISTWEGQQLAYAAVSGDNNFIHTSHVLARMSGLPRTILHGVCFMAMCCSSLTRRQLADDLSRLKSVRGRFSGFVLPGQSLTLVGYAPSAPGEQPFAVFNSAGQEVMKNGLFRSR